MSFFSINFGIYFSIFWMFFYYFKFSVTVQKILLLAFSYYFLYTCAGESGTFVLAINVIFAICIWFWGIFIYHFHSKFSLVLAICSIVFLLAFFKYIKFFEPIAIFLAQISDSNLLIANALPIGISYYSFMAIGYLVHLYKRKIKRQSLLNTLVFLSFFVTITSGPILGAKGFFTQLNRVRKNPAFYARCGEIYTLFTLSFFKIFIIANWTSKIIEPIFKTPQIYPSSVLIAALCGYSIMLYAQFSGFIDMSRALGVMIGFNIPKNFNRPFRALNLQIFWRRWHISLMKFFMEFVYIPLGGSRLGTARKWLNIGIVFVISGVWHGSGSVWEKYIIWGLIHAFGMIFCLFIAKFGVDFLKFGAFKRFVTFLFVSFAWIYFSFGDIGIIEANIFLKTLIFGFLADFWRILFVFCVVFFGLLIYNQINFFCLIKRMFLRTNSVVICLFFIIYALVIYKLMPNEIPNFMYGDF